jgi:hypothetical protein
VHLQLAEIYLKRGDVAGAIDEVRAAAEIAPPDQSAELEQQVAQLKAREVDYWADAEPDCRVDAADLQAVSRLWRCEEGDPCYSARYDRDDDGAVTVIDLMAIVAAWNWTCP